MEIAVTVLPHRAADRPPAPLLILGEGSRFTLVSLLGKGLGNSPPRGEVTEHLKKLKFAFVRTPNF